MNFLFFCCCFNEAIIAEMSDKKSEAEDIMEQINRDVDEIADMICRVQIIPKVMRNLFCHRAICNDWGKSCRLTITDFDDSESESEEEFEDERVEESEEISEDESEEESEEKCEEKSEKISEEKTILIQLILSKAILIITILPTIVPRLSCLRV
ncbi:Transient receptor potential cation channel subfamily M member [Trichinella spiralis]|uniref:Transient receptor potential cation channel subfamily M member n=1 Tax=Trichinella spiralis TaxID=6334 RepID=A0ABR3KKL3_TRISP